MKHTFTLLALLICCGVANAQTTVKVKWLKSETSDKEVPEGKSEVMEITTTYGNGQVTVERTNVKTGKRIFIESLRGEEPVGVWQYGESPALDYDFDIIYSEANCPVDSSLLPVTDLLVSYDSLGYLAPQFPEGQTLIKFLARSIIYPAYARDNDIQGKVLVNCVINNQGVVENITVRRGAHPTLDKEAVRVVRMLRFLNPAKLNGVPKSFCMIIPVVFKLM